MQMKNLLLFLVLVCTNSFAQSEKIENYMKLAHERNFFNGNVLVMKQGKPIYEGSFGSRDASGENALTPDIRMEIGSISKEFNAVGIMMLKEEGKLSLEDKVSKYFPELPAWAEKVSIKNLLQYTAGFPDVNLVEPITNEKGWEFLRDLKKLQFEPGTDYNYTNYNIFLQKRIIERITGVPYAEFLDKKIFSPLEMEGAVVDPDPEATGIAKAFDLRMTEDEPIQYFSGLMYLTPGDLYKWVQGLHTNRLISRESLLFLSERPHKRQTSLGSVVLEADKIEYHYHQGSSYNYESSFFYLPELEVSIILMTNSKRFNTADITNGLMAILQGEESVALKRSIYLCLRTEVMYEGIEKALEYFEKISRSERDLYNFEEEEDQLLNVGNYLVGKDKIKDAVAIFELTAKRHPDSSEVFLALGKAYEGERETDLAIANYKKSIELNKDNLKAKASLRLLQNQTK